MLAPHAPRIPRLTPLQSAILAVLAMGLVLVPPTITPRLAPRDDSHDPRPPGSALLYADRLDANEATARDFEALPGIGAAGATEIVAERARRGGFCSVEELRRVAHVGGRPWRQIVERVAITPAPGCPTSRSSSSRG